MTGLQLTGFRFLKFMSRMLAISLSYEGEFDNECANNSW